MTARKKGVRKKTGRKKKATEPQEPLAEVDDDADDPEGFPEIESLSYFGTDFDVHGLVRRLNEEDIVVPSFDPQPDAKIVLAGFQRGFVWKRLQMDRFIESLLLGFPVPGIFLVQQSDKKLLVLDGQQRLRTLQEFYADKFQLETVTHSLQGVMYSTLETEARRTLDNTFIHATIVKYEEENEGDDSVYQLFERLNAGGTNLYPQEIRVALYHGQMVEFIRELNNDPNWRALFGAKSPRLKDQELILRFLALFLEHEKYERPLRAFLNHFLKRHRNLEEIDRKKMGAVFTDTCKLLNQAVGKQAFRLTSNVNAALVDAVMVGASRKTAPRLYWR